MKFVFALVCIIGIAAAYNRKEAVAYAKKWYDGANHDCNSGFEDCTPWAYYGNEHCGYGSNGGDCANFVSQCLIAGGHKYLNQGGPCRGYPCGKEEVEAKGLGDCLVQYHGWKSTCDYMAPPPSYIKHGDVLIYHANSCDDYDAHAVIVVQGGAEATIACHSSSRYGVAYNYNTAQPYYQWLHYDD